MKIFVGGLPKDITDKDLYDAFEDFGTVSSAKVITDKKTGISRSYGFVEMPDPEQGRRAIEALHEAVVDGQTVSVKLGVDPEPPAKKKGKPAGNTPFRKTFKVVRKVEPQQVSSTAKAGKRKRNSGYNPGKATD
jgi:RNA recognition motif-containing protein